MAALRVAVIGAGPAGFFLADRLLAAGAGAAVDMYERLPAPYGLVRFGVAPDHEKIRNVTRSFDKVAGRDGFRFFGNVEVSRHVDLATLRRYYHAVAFSTGAPTDRRLGIPGEDLEGSHAATEFVAWYNGHPDYVDRQFDLGVTSVAVIGVGNVAVDVARILCRTQEELAATDIAGYALEALAASQVRQVFLLGRRGPVQAAFTTPEVKELGELPGADVQVIPDEIALDPVSRHALEHEADAATRRKVEVLEEFARREPAGKSRLLTLRFLVSPVEILDDGTGRVGGVRLMRNRLVERDGSLRAEPTGETEELQVQLVFRSVGYRGLPIPGLPFDDRAAVVPNADGRVLDPRTGAPIPGLFVSGWIKRGPTGVIGTNKPDAAQTADAILEDAGNDALPTPGGTAEELDELIHAAQPDVVGWPDWLLLSTLETNAGKAAGRPRIKHTSVEAMLAAIRAGQA